MSAKYEQLADILRSEIVQLRHQGKSKLDTEAVLTQRYHMSRQTVRSALKLLEQEGLICRRQGSGSYITEQEPDPRSRKIAVIAARPDAYILPAVLHDVKRVFADEGYSVEIFATEDQVDRERQILRSILDGEICALLTEGSRTGLPTPNDDLYRSLRERGIPVLFFRGVYKGLEEFPCLGDDGRAGGVLLARYLLGKGHHRIAGVMKLDDVQGPERYHGIVSALRDAGAPIRDSAFFWYGSDDWEGSILDRFLEERLGDATAVVCYDDEIAAALIRRLLERGKAVPEDVAVVSFDNSFLSRLGPVPITSLGRKGRLGELAAAGLLELLAGREPKQLTMEWELAVRQSG